MIHQVGSIRLDDSRIENAIAQAVLFGENNKQDYRGDISATGPGKNVVDAYARHCDGLALRGLGEGFRLPPELIAAGRRADAFGPGAGSAPRDLEYVRQQALDEPLPLLNAERLFKADHEVPLGAQTHVMERWLTSGEAQITRGGSSIPVVTAGKEEERFPVIYVICGIRQNFFTGLNVNYGNLRTFQIESRAAVRLVKERSNRIWWGGDEGTGLKGVLNYPHMTKYVEPILFDGTATGPQMVAAMANLVGTPRIVSKQVFYPNRLLVSETVHQLIHETQFAAGTDTTVAEFFLKGQVGKPNGITRIEAVYELEANSDEMLKAGAPANMHGMFAYRDDIGALRRVVVQEPTWLPMWQSGPFDMIQCVMAALGGIVEPDVGNNVLAFVNAGV